MSSRRFDPALVAAYIEYGRVRIEYDVFRDDLDWAYDRVTAIVEGKDTNQAFELVAALVEYAPATVLNYIAAGPIEDLLCWHGPKVIERLLKVADGDAKMRFALHGVWGQNRMDSAVWQRLQDAIRGWARIH